MTGSGFQNKEVCLGKYAIKCNKKLLILFKVRLWNWYNVVLGYLYMGIFTYVLA